MLSFDYTIDLQIEDTLKSIDRIRSHILTLALSSMMERKFQWEGTTIRTWATLALAGREAPKHHVAAILAHPAKPNASARTIYAVRSAYDYIHESWRANPKPVSLAALETIFTALAPEKSSQFSKIEQDLKDLLTFLDTERAHPVVQASIAHIHILTLPGEAELGLFARMVHYLLLAKYGYDLRGFATPERVWQEDVRTYVRLTDTYAGNRHMTQWLAFMAESMRRTLESLAGDIEVSRFHIEFPQSFWQLSDRQKDIMTHLEPPGAAVTNKKVQKRFRVSQITASRDLSRLATLGLIYPHGKGRSIYYTKI